MRIPNLNSYLNKKAYLSHQAFLLYGNDEGVLQFHLDLLIQRFKKEGFALENVPTLEDVNLGQEPELFETPNQKKVIICRKITGKDFSLLEKKLAAKNPNHKLIVVGPNLGTKIKLVQFFQNQSHVSSIPSYEVSLALLRSVIESSLQERSLILSLEHIDILVETYSHSPLSLFRDLEKIELYCYSNPKITTNQLKQLINGSLKRDVDQIIEGFLERNRKKMLHHTDCSFLEADPYLILRSLIRQMTTFCEFMSHCQFTSSAAQAISAMKTPLFFSTKPLFQRVQSIWTVKLAANGLRHLLFLEKRFKNGEISTPQFQSELCLYTRSKSIC